MWSSATRAAFAIALAALLAFVVVRARALLKRRATRYRDLRPRLRLADLVEARTTVFYHHPCTDGFAAMVCALHALRPGARFVACAAGGVGGDALRPDRLRELANRYVLFLDCAPPLAVVRAIADIAADVLVLDHHKATLDQLSPLPGRYKWLDMQRSGAMLAWNFFLGGAAEPHESARVAPWFVHYVQDNDLYTHALPQSRAFSAFANKDLDVVLFTRMLTDTDPLAPGAIGALTSEVFRQAVAEGERIAVEEQAAVQKALADVHVHCSVLPDGKRYRVAYYRDAPFAIRSQLGNLMATSFACDFAALYTYDAAKNVTGFSLRSLHSQGTGADVDAVARLFGGGGHVSASGCNVPGRVEYLGALV